MDETKIKEIAEMLLNAKPNRQGIVMIPSVNGYDVYRLPEDVLKVFLYSQSALAKETKQQGNCNLPNVSNKEVAVEPERHKCINCGRDYKDIDDAIMCCYVGETDC